MKKIGECSSLEDVNSAVPTSEATNFHHLPKNICPAVCVICGDRSTGYHYEVPSCNGCKTFFRRTILSHRKYECPKDGKCFDIIPIEQKCICRSCRFAKCVKVGMNPRAIQTNSPINHESVLKKIGIKRKTEGMLSTSKNEIIPSLNISFNNEQITQLIDGLSYLEIKVEDFRKCAFIPTSLELTKLNELLTKSSLIALADKVGPMPNWPTKNLELKSLNIENEDFSFYCKKYYKKNWFIYDMLTSVEYAKTFMFLHKISRKDQILLLRSVTLKIMNLNQSFYSYEHNFDGILHPDGTTPIFCIKKFDLKEKNWDSIFNALRSFMHLKLDRTEYILFKALTLCNPTIDGLSNHAVNIISKEKLKYCDALLKYCLAHRGANGPAHFAACLAITHGIEVHQKNQKDFHRLRTIFHSNPRKEGNEFLDDIMEETT